MFTSWPTVQIAYEIIDWCCRLVALAVVPLRRRPAASAGWLLLIMFLPIPGMAMFAIIGSPRFPAWRIKRFELLTPYFAAVSLRLSARSTIEPSRFDDVIALTQHLGQLPPVPGNAVHLMDDYDAMLAQLAADIWAAERYVLLLVYIFADDEAGRTIIDALRGAASRGWIAGS